MISVTRKNISGVKPYTCSMLSPRKKDHLAPLHGTVFFFTFHEQSLPCVMDVSDPSAAVASLSIN